MGMDVSGQDNVTCLRIRGGEIVAVTSFSSPLYFYKSNRARWLSLGFRARRFCNASFSAPVCSRLLKVPHSRRFVLFCFLLFRFVSLCLCVCYYLCSRCWSTVGSLTASAEAAVAARRETASAASLLLGAGKGISLSKYLQTVTTTWMCQIARLMIPMADKFALLIPLLVVKREKYIGGAFVFVTLNT